MSSDRCDACGEDLGLTEYGARHARCSASAPELDPPLRSYHTDDGSPCICTAGIPEAGCPLHDPCSASEELSDLRRRARSCFRLLSHSGALSPSGGTLPDVTVRELHDTAAMLDRLSSALSVVGARLFAAAVERVEKSS